MDESNNLMIDSDLSFVTAVGTLSTGTWQADPIDKEYIADIDQTLLKTSNVLFSGLSLTEEDIVVTSIDDDINLGGQTPSSSKLITQSAVKNYLDDRINQNVKTTDSPIFSGITIGDGSTITTISVSYTHLTLPTKA